MIVDEICNLPAKVISNFKKENQSDYPKFKGAVIEWRCLYRRRKF